MTTNRTPAEKANDTRYAFNIFRDELTPPLKREVLANMTGAQMEAIASTGDVQAYAALVQASLQLDRVISANDRAALIAAAMITQSGVSRPQLDVVED